MSIPYAHPKTHTHSAFARSHHCDFIVAMWILPALYKYIRWNIHSCHVWGSTEAHKLNSAARIARQVKQFSFDFTLSVTRAKWKGKCAMAKKASLWWLFRTSTTKQKNSLILSKMQMIQSERVFRMFLLSRNKLNEIKCSRKALVFYIRSNGAHTITFTCVNYRSHGASLSVAPLNFRLLSKHISLRNSSRRMRDGFLLTARHSPASENRCDSTCYYFFVLPHAATVSMNWL